MTLNRSTNGRDRSGRRCDDVNVDAWLPLPLADANDGNGGAAVWLIESICDDVLSYDIIQHRRRHRSHVGGDSK